MCLCCYCVVFLSNHKTQHFFGFLFQNTKNTNQHLGIFIFCFMDFLDLFFMSEDKKKIKTKLRI